jgi:L-fuculose-phosphate aldolase
MSWETDAFRPDDFEGRYHFGRVPVIAVADQDYLNESPERVAAALQDSPVAIIRGHGIYARGETLDEAYKWSCSLESSARLTWMARVADIKPGTHS